MITTKSFKMMFLFVLAITVIFNSSYVWCKNDLVGWDECTELLVQLRNCSFKLHLPKNCDDHYKSELLECIESALENLHLCKDNIAIRMLKNYVDTFQHSDRILCQKHMYTEFAENRRCNPVARLIAVHMAASTPGTLSEKGCNVLKSVMYVLALNLKKIGCYDILEEYIEALYNKSSCSHVHVQVPTYDHIKEIRTVISHLITCWFSHSDLPTCRNVFSERMQCVSTVSTAGVNQGFKLIIENFLEVTKETDKVICNNKKLYQDFQDHKDCWSYVKTVGLFIVGQANGFLTKDGCNAVKYRENISMALFDQNCAKLLLDYRKYMDIALPCHQAAPAPGSLTAVGFGVSIHASSLALVYVVSVIFVMILNGKSNFMLR